MAYPGSCIARRSGEASPLLVRLRRDDKVGYPEIIRNQNLGRRSCEALCKKDLAPRTSLLGEEPELTSAEERGGSDHSWPAALA